MTATLQAPSLSLVDLRDDEGSTTLTGLPGEFCLHYQPQLDLQSGAVLAAEALLRWSHPEFGLISPHASLHGTRWAEEISSLEAWAVAEVCRQGAHWGHRGLPVEVACNVSTAYLLRPGFVDSLCQNLDRSGLSPYLLAVDIPMAALATNAAHAERVCRRLDEVGIGVIVDSVVGGPRTAAISMLGAQAWKIDLPSAGRGADGFHDSVALAVEQAHEAGALAIAKAVEDDVALAHVRELGFDAMFGNVLSAPVPARVAIDEFRTAPPRLRPLFGPVG